MSDGHRFTLGIWEKPTGAAGIGWEVPRAEVLDKVRWANRTFNVIRGYYDPHEWRSDIDTLADELGVDKVIAWATSRDVQMAGALDRLAADMRNGSTFHDDDKRVENHYRNAYIRHRGYLRLVRKEYPNSPRKIDGVVTDALAYQARADALTAGYGTEKPTSYAYVY